ncbi:DNA polymerase alpha subunit B [Cyphellophora attinorum]|uniref:DNA polymerase alpha subunit B n=1 Tax=Cyphellophora attinorum TaxID=1664694 RepID=A0A0N0NKK2_9EURO|nr:DNA polymerase alpha subunit B [Phialophora attinorum]KPI38241.1 DNA polymerase alpha subunit B [Phialophora attinorum]
MSDEKENLNALFAPAAADGLPEDILGVLESTQRLHSISAQELFYKWESYCLKMGSEETKLDLDTSRMFQKDIQDQLERGNQGKHAANTRGLGGKQVNAPVGATPRGVKDSSDVFGMFDDLTPSTLKKSGSAKSTAVKSPLEGSAIPFASRANPGQILETLNGQIAQPEPPLAPPAEPRVKLIANTDIKKFSYRPMAQRLSSSSEVLDERIDAFIPLIQSHHKLEDSAFGNAAAQSTNEIVAVGRICCDTPENKLNASSIVLEMSRRMGAGLRVTLDVSAVKSYCFFPGQIVAVRGTNASGMYFSVKEVLEIPLLPMPSSQPAALETISDKLDEQPVKILFGCGPYTADDNLNFEPLAELCEKAAEQVADALILTGPFLDTEHPILASGDFDMPAGLQESDPISLSALFRVWIAAPIQKLLQQNPNITIVMVPSTRDAICKHVSFPQESLTGKKELGLGSKQIKLLPNPCFISLNEVVVAICGQDTLYDLSREQLSFNVAGDVMSRLPGLVVQQRHFYPLFPPARGSGKMMSLDGGYVKLAEWGNVRPDVLLMGGGLTAGVKVVDSVLTLNPGQLSKKKAAGTYASMVLQRGKSPTKKEKGKKRVDACRMSRIMCSSGHGLMFYESERRGHGMVSDEERIDEPEHLRIAMDLH